MFLCGSVLFISSPARAQDAPVENPAPPDNAPDSGNGAFPSGGFSFDSVLSDISYVDIMNAFIRGEVDADGLRMFLGMKASALYGQLSKYQPESSVPPPAPPETAAPTDATAPAEEDSLSSVNPMSVALELLNAFLAGEIDPESAYEALLRFGFGMGCHEARAADCLERLFGKEDKDKAEKDKAEKQDKQDKSKEESQSKPLKFEGLLGHWFEGSGGNGSSALEGLRASAPTTNSPSAHESCK